MNRKALVHYIIYLAAFAAAALRLFQLAFFPPQELLSWTPRASKSFRGSILDRTGEPLALSADRWNIYFDSRKKFDSNKLAAAAAVLSMELSVLQKASKLNKAVLLKRFSPPEEAKAVRLMRQDAFLLENVKRRVYPGGRLLSHTLGFTGFEGKGFNGIERRYNEELSAGSGKSVMNAVLSIDSALQKRVEELLARQMQKVSASSGTVLVQDAATGKFLAMACSPDFDPNAFEKEKESTFRNPMVRENLEPGSVFKIFFIAYLIEKYHADVKTKKYYSSGKFKLVNEEIVKDTHAFGMVSIEDIVKYSVNSGMIQATEKLTRDEMYDFLLQMRFGLPSGIDLPGENAGILRRPRDWGVRDKAVIPIGQGIAVTPVQLITAFSALVNGGIWNQPALLNAWLINSADGSTQTNEMPAAESMRVISERTSKEVIRLLSFGTLKGSTGERASETGFDPIGKTGTSQLVRRGPGGYYSNRYNALFIGAYPPEKPKVTILVIVTDPKTGFTGGAVAAPLFAEVLAAGAEQLGFMNRREAEVIADEALKSEVPEIKIENGKVPDFSGLSKRDAVILAAKLSGVPGAVKVQVKGSGYVITQKPSAGSDYTSNTVIRLELKAP